MKLSRNSAFTLVELLVTMGIMAMLATVSVAGYYSATKGMTERGIREDVRAIVRLAAERALIDNRPTAVFLMNTLFRDDNIETGEGRRVAGLAVVVRMAGRISYIKNGCLCDEFADWDQTFANDSASGTTSGSSDQSMRLYRMVKGLNGSAAYSLVSDYIERVNFSSEVMLGLNVTTNSAYTVGFRKHSGGSASWRVGDPYGFEIASMQLPYGYVFDGSVPSQVGDVRMVNTVNWFFPDELDANKTDVDSFDFKEIGIRAYGANGTLKDVLTIRKSDLKDDADS